MVPSPILTEPRSFVPIFFQKAPVLPPPSSCTSSVVFEQGKEKVSKGILREVFGEGLMHAIEVFNATHPQTLGTSQEGVERSGLEADLAALCGTETEPGKLQVSDKVHCGKTCEHVCLSRQDHSRDIRT